MSAALLALCAATSAPAAAQDWSLPGPYAAGETTVTVTRPNASTFTARLHYPALSAGTNTAFDASGAPYPGVSFGHGFLQPVDSYRSTLAHLATWGYLVIAPTTQGGFLPSHAAFGTDLQHALTWFEEQQILASSPYFGALDTAAFALSGHSMGGGAAILAAASDPRVRVLLPLAPAETNPSAISALASTAVPVRLLVGDQDTIVPTANHGAPMYAAAPGPRQLVALVGGWHCGFVDTVVFGGLGCDSGSLSRTAQLALVRRELTRACAAYLRQDEGALRELWGPLGAGDSALRMQRDARFRVTPRSARSAAAAGQVALVQIEVHNDGAEPGTFGLAVTGAWPAALSAQRTPLIAPGQSAVIDVRVTVPAPPAASADRLTVTITREADGATTQYVALGIARQ